MTSQRAHLAAISPEWQASVGVGKSVNWPTGIGAKGNEGVAAQLSQLRGSIGYVEAAHGKPPLQAAALTNASGELVPLNLETQRAAPASNDPGPGLIGRNANPVKGYPIVTLNWILLYWSGNGSKWATLQKVFAHTLADQAQSMAPALGFVAFPAPVLAQCRRGLASIQPLGAQPKTRRHRGTLTRAMAVLHSTRAAAQALSSPGPLASLSSSTATAVGAAACSTTAWRARVGRGVSRLSASIAAGNSSSLIVKAGHRRQGLGRLPWGWRSS